MRVKSRTILQCLRTFTPSEAGVTFWSSQEPLITQDLEWLWTVDWKCYIRLCWFELSDASGLPISNYWRSFIWEIIWNLQLSIFITILLLCHILQWLVILDKDGEWRIFFIVLNVENWQMICLILFDCVLDDINIYRSISDRLTYVLEYLIPTCTHCPEWAYKCLIHILYCPQITT